MLTYRLYFNINVGNLVPESITYSKFWTEDIEVDSKTERKNYKGKSYNSAIIKHSKSQNLRKILTINSLPLVSIDFNHNSSSSIFDTTQTHVVNNNFCRVLSWYDNEWGFSNRMIETMLDMRRFL